MAACVAVQFGQLFDDSALGTALAGRQYVLELSGGSTGHRGCLDDDSWQSVVGEVCASSFDGDWTVEATVRMAADRLAESAGLRKLAGNAAVKAGDWPTARTEYAAGLVELEAVVVPLAAAADGDGGDDEEAGLAAVRELRMVLYCNRAAASIGWVKKADAEAAEAAQSAAAAAGAGGFFDGAGGAEVPADLELSAELGLPNNDQKKKEEAGGSGAAAGGQPAQEGEPRQEISEEEEEEEGFDFGGRAAAERRLDQRTRWREALLVSALRDTDAASALGPRYAPPCVQLLLPLSPAWHLKHRHAAAGGPRAGSGGGEHSRHLGIGQR